MVGLTREGTGVASAEGSPEIDWNKKKLIEGHVGEAMEAKTDEQRMKAEAAGLTASAVEKKYFCF